MVVRQRFDSKRDLGMLLCYLLLNELDQLLNDVQSKIANPTCTRRRDTPQSPSIKDCDVSIDSHNSAPPWHVLASGFAGYRIEGIAPMRLVPEGVIVHNLSLKTSF